MFNRKSSIKLYHVSNMGYEVDIGTICEIYRSN